jgi:DNA-binding winged helix-turn-helix (wHTH) protein
LRPNRLELEDLVLDTAAQKAARGDRQNSLTTKEYALLEYLARNAGRAAGREEISEHVWDETFDPFSDIIEVYMNCLRHKIDEHEARVLIHTRRGAGYKLGGAETCGAATRVLEQTTKPDGLKTKPGRSNDENSLTRRGTKTRSGQTIMA